MRYQITLRVGERERWKKGEVVITKIRQIRISQISGTILDRLIGKLD